MSNRVLALAISGKLGYTFRWSHFDGGYFTYVVCIGNRVWVCGSDTMFAKVPSATIYRQDVCTLFWFDSNSGKSGREVSVIPRGHSKRGYGDNGVACRRSIENVQPVVRNNWGAAVRHGRSKKEKRYNRKALERSRPPVQ